MTSQERVVQLESFIAETLPFLEEAWKACFNGKEKALLSCEERGMGRLLATFKQIANGKPALSPGVITVKEAAEREEEALAWAHRLLGQPNSLNEELQRYMMAGDTCVDGIKNAHAKVVDLESALAERDAEIKRLRENNKTVIELLQRNLEDALAIANWQAKQPLTPATAPEGEG